MLLFYVCKKIPKDTHCQWDHLILMYLLNKYVMTSTMPAASKAIITKTLRQSYEASCTQHTSQCNTWKLLNRFHKWPLLKTWQVIVTEQFSPLEGSQCSTTTTKTPASFKRVKKYNYWQNRAMRSAIGKVTEQIKCYQFNISLGINYIDYGNQSTGRIFSFFTNLVMQWNLIYTKIRCLRWMISGKLPSNSGGIK